jgi:hypothetical protein
MSETVMPPRPDENPDEWVTQFYYTDAYGPPGYSRTRAWGTRAEAVEEVDEARARHDGGGVKVQIAFAFPPLGADDKPYAVDFERGRI